MDADDDNEEVDNVDDNEEGKEEVEIKRKRRRSKGLTYLKNVLTLR